uniref:thioredoxin family protein n=1 Tax=Fulvivirga sp. TaxID=1931237 RepID=UPI00404A7B93
MNTLTESNPIQSALEKSFSYQDYSALITEYVANGKTTGTKQTQELIDYTKLNAKRSSRVEKTLLLQDETVTALQSVKVPQTWILITESWCGDAANSVAAIAKIAEMSPLVELRIVLRDEHPALIDQFLTNGGRSIPKLIALDDDSKVLFTWGPRPNAAQELFRAWKSSDPQPTSHEFHIQLQQWYNADKSIAIQQEIVELVNASLK